MILPDTPWHIEYPRKDEDEPRRHKSRCIHFANDICFLRHEKCCGSAHCRNYTEEHKVTIWILDAEFTKEPFIVHKKNKTKRKQKRIFSLCNSCSNFDKVKCVCKLTNKIVVNNYKCSLKS